MKHSLELIEMKAATLAHLAALKDVLHLWRAGKVEGAVARLEGSIAYLEGTARGHIAGMSVTCETCNETSPAEEWLANEGNCPKCDEELPPIPEENPPS